MGDVYHDFGSDLQLAANGDLLTVSSVAESRQRVLRRLLTNPGDYIWNLSYGAGLPAQVGQLGDQTAMAALIRAQMYLEPSVIHDPEPQVSVSTFQTGLNALIQYVETDSNQETTLSFKYQPNP